MKEMFDIIRNYFNCSYVNPVCPVSHMLLHASLVKKVMLDNMVVQLSM